jgi:hypothetical protein
MIQPTSQIRQSHRHPGLKNPAVRFAGSDSKADGFFSTEPFPPSLKPQNKLVRNMKRGLSSLFSGLALTPQEKKLNKLLNTLSTYLNKGEVKVSADSPHVNKKEGYYNTTLDVKGANYGYIRNTTREFFFTFIDWDIDRSIYHYSLARNGPNITLDYASETKTLSYTDQEQNINITSKNRFLRRKAVRVFSKIERLTRKKVKQYATKQKEQAYLDTLKKELEERQKPDLRL